MDRSIDLAVQQMQMQHKYLTAVLVQAREHDKPDDDVEQRGEGGGVDDRGGGGEGVPQACLSQRDLVRYSKTLQL